VLPPERCHRMKVYGEKTLASYLQVRCVNVINND
jgi:hypothetical protein